MAFFKTDDGCQLYYEEKGHGEPLIFIHGWSCNHKFFKYQLDEFAKDYRVIAYDFRGHGQSDRGENTERGMNLTRFGKDLQNLIDYLNLDKVNLVGWSMGTSTLLAYVREFGTKHIKKMNFIDMTPKLLNDDQWKLGQSCTFTIKDNLAFTGVLVTNWEMAAQLFLPNCFAKGTDENSDEFQWTKAQVMNNTPHCMVNMWTAMAVEDFREVLPDIDVPVLLTYSGDGLIYGPSHAEYMEKNIAGKTKIVIFPGCGHALFIEDHEKYNKELKTFLTE